MTATLSRDDWQAAIWAAPVLPGTKLVCLAVAARLRWPAAHVAQSVPVAALAEATRFSALTCKVHVRRAGAWGLFALAIAGPGDAAEVLPSLPPDEPPAPRRVAHRLFSFRRGDPRWAAWIVHDVAQPDTATAAAEAQRTGAIYKAPTPWPPDSPLVSLRAIDRNFFIPHGTPEHAAWVAFLRHEVGASVAAVYESNPFGMRQRSRWPQLMPKHMGPPGSTP